MPAIVRKMITKLLAIFGVLKIKPLPLLRKNKLYRRQMEVRFQFLPDPGFLVAGRFSMRDHHRQIPERGSPAQSGQFRNFFSQQLRSKMPEQEFLRLLIGERNFNKDTLKPLGLNDRYDHLTVHLYHFGL